MPNTTARPIQPHDDPEPEELVGPHALHLADVLQPSAGPGRIGPDRCLCENWGGPNHE